MAAEAVISSAVQLLGDLLIQKVRFLRGVEGQVELLKDELKRMQSFLRDANRKQAQEDRVRNWISEIRELAHDVQDAIELFVLKVETKGLMGMLSSLPKHAYYVNNVGKEIESIQRRLESIHRSRELYGIKDLGEVSDSAWRLQVESRRRLSPWQKDEHLVGVEDDLKKLLRESILDEEQKGLSVAAVEEMGGIGKSTLARAIFNHRDVAAGRFDHRGWVVVSSEFAPQETIKQITFQLQMSEQDKKKLLEEMKELEESMKDKLYIQEELKQMLHKQLDGKSYLVVLDDVWEKEHLESLITAFPNRQDKRSRLSVTTRNKITMKYDHQYVHKMKLLDSENSWGLFLNKAFGSINGKCPEELMSIGRQILEKCCGLPLAISVVGGLLIGIQSKTAWEQVLNQINSYLGISESSVSAILELSYQNLSPQLKSCFLCLAFFKEDYTIPAKRLVNIWVGQGLIQQQGSITLGEIARGYLSELINRSMVQIEDLTIDDRVKNCRLHDLVREVCIRKATKEIGLEIVKGEDGCSSSESPYKSRHHVVYGGNLETSSLKHNKYLRSLYLVNISQLFSVIDWIEDDERIHRNENFIDDVLELPSWLDHLKNIEVLDLESEYAVFPNVALKMERLRHFHVSCVFNKPMKIENWKNIEALKHIRVEDWMKCRSRLMAAGCHLRELGILMNRYEDNNMVRASLETMANLVELHLEFGHSFSMRHIFPHLDSVTIVKVSSAGGMLDRLAASDFPPNLSHLTLLGVDVDGDPMLELGKLPKLQYLTLWHVTFSFCNDQCWTMRVLHDGFPCLTALSLHQMNNLRGINIEQGGMPRLKHLKIHHCPNLQTQNLPKHIIILAA